MLVWDECEPPEYTWWCVVCSFDSTPRPGLIKVLTRSVGYRKLWNHYTFFLAFDITKHLVIFSYGCLAYQLRIVLLSWSTYNYQVLYSVHHDYIGTASLKTRACAMRLDQLSTIQLSPFAPVRLIIIFSTLSFLLEFTKLYYRI